MGSTLVLQTSFLNIIMTLLPLENDLIQVQILSKLLVYGYVNMEIKYLHTKRRKRRSYRSTARPRGRCTSFSSQTSGNLAVLEI